MAKVHEYRSEDIIVTYDVRRCIHAAECVHGLPGVFDPERKPWIEPAQGSADEVAEVVARCPTGALRFERLDGGPAEGSPPANTAVAAQDGPLYASGDLEVQVGDVTVRESRAALCRCGASKNKPYCDNSHLEIEFCDSGALGEGRLVPPDEEPVGSVVTLTAAPNGPLLVGGPLTVRSANGEASCYGTRGALCRCGGSSKKPYCDGTHKAMASEDEWGH